MRLIAAVSAVFAASLLSTSAPASDAQNWRWKLDAGKSYDYEYRSTTDINVEMSMMGQASTSDRIGVDTDFSLRVDRVLPDGRYDLRIPITSLVIHSASGQRITLQDLPAELQTLRAYMTPKGRFQFYERVVVEVHPGGAYGLARVQQRGEVQQAELTVGVDDLQVTASATVDAKTGRVTMVHSARKAPSKSTTKVEEEREVQQIDVLPADLLALLELPEGRVAPGSTLDVAMPMGTLNVAAGEPQPCGEASCGNLRVRLKADSAKATSAAQISPGAGGFGGDPGGATDDDMFAGMGDMGETGMDGMDGMPDLSAMMGGAPGASATPTMKLDLDVTALFNPAAGRMWMVAGTTGSSTQAPGMTMTESTKFKLRFYGVK